MSSFIIGNAKYVAMSFSTITTIASGVYTLYCIHPYIPYRFIWKHVAVPTLNYISRKEKVDQEKGLEFYEIISESRDSDTGVVTRYLVLKTDNDSEFEIVNNKSTSVSL